MSCIDLCFLYAYLWVFCVSRQRKLKVVRRESVLRVELAELRTELDLDMFSRLQRLSKAFSHCPTQTAKPGLLPVGLELCSSHNHIVYIQKVNDSVYL